MKILEQYGWVYYVSDQAKSLDKNKCGKWLCYFGERESITRICREAVEKNIVVEAKHSDAQNGMSCFYLNIDDIEGHKRIIQFLLDKDVIRKTKKGNLSNISFKLDNQTRAGEYGNGFVSVLKLDKFIDLTTGLWKV